MEDERSVGERVEALGGLADAVLVKDYQAFCIGVRESESDGGGPTSFPAVLWSFTGRSLAGHDGAVKILVPADLWPELDRLAIHAMDDVGVSPGTAWIAPDDADDDDADDDDAEANGDLPEADDDADEGWWDLASDLMEVVELLEPGQFLVLAAPGNRFVRLEIHEEGARVEMVSNQFLEPEYRLIPEIVDELANLGWNPPTRSTSGEGGPETGCPNHFMDLDENWQTQEVAHLLTEALTEIHQIHFPFQLTYSAGSVDGETILFPSLGLRRARA